MTTASLLQGVLAATCNEDERIDNPQSYPSMSMYVKQQKEPFQSCPVPLVMVLLAGTLAAPLEPAFARVAPPVVRRAQPYLRLGTTRLRPADPGATFCLSEDGRTLAAGGAGGVSLWQIPSGQLLRHVEVPGALDCVCQQFTADGQWLAVSVLYRYHAAPGGPSEGVSLINLRTGKVTSLRRRNRETISRILLLSRGTILGCMVDDRRNEGVRGFCLYGLPQGRPLGTIADVVCVASSADGTMLATAHSKGVVRLWRPDGLRELGILKLPLPPFALAFGRDGKSLAVVDGRGSVHIWDVASRKLARSFPREAGDPVALGFSPAGNLVYLASAGQSESEQEDRQAKSKSGTRRPASLPSLFRRSRRASAWWRSPQTVRRSLWWTRTVASRSFP